MILDFAVGSRDAIGRGIWQQSVHSKSFSIFQRFDFSHASIIFDRKVDSLQDSSSEFVITRMGRWAGGLDLGQLGHFVKKDNAQSEESYFSIPTRKHAMQDRQIFFRIECRYLREQIELPILDVSWSRRVRDRCQLRWV